MSKKKSAKKTVKKSKSALTHIAGFEVKNTGSKTDEGCDVYVDTNSTYWVYNPETGEVRKQ